MTLSVCRHAAVIVMMMIAIASCGGGPPREEPGPTSATAFGLPAENELPGWSRITEPEHYEADNLWEYINGQADFFIDYGFVRVDAAEYRSNRESIPVVSFSS